MKAKNVNVAVIGAGIMGLLLTRKLAAMGYTVTMIEKNVELAKSPSTRNEGWLHRGTYHSYGIENETQAIEVAQSCIYGYEQIKKNYPECMEEPFTNSVALIKSKENAEYATERWRKSGVAFTQLCEREVSKQLHDVNVPNGASCFNVMETAINTRILLHLLHQEIEMNKNAKIYTGCKCIHFINDTKCILDLGEEMKEVNADIFIYTAGYGVKDIFSKEFAMELPLRVFKSHLLITKRMSKNNVFYIEPDNVTAMHHGNITIVGSTKENLCTTQSDYDNDEVRAGRLIENTKMLFRKKLDDFSVYACHKVDWYSGEEFQSLNPVIKEPMTNHIIALPGKMTEAPYVCDTLLRTVFERLGNCRVAKRPCDTYLPENIKQLV